MQKQLTDCLARVNSLIEQKEPDNSSLFYGRAGLLYYYHHVFRFTGNYIYLGKCKQLFGALMETHFAQGAACKDVSFVNGITGVCSVLHALRRQNLLNRLPSVVAETDEYLYHFCMNERVPCTFNFMEGTAGITSYFCKQTPTPLVRKYLNYITDHLFIHHEPVHAETEINFTLWQGVSGTIHLLFRLLHIFPEKATLRFTLLHYLQLLRSHILQIDTGLNRVGFFPASANRQTGLINAPNCLFWETGDLPVAHIFYKAYSFFGDKEYKKIADLAGAFTLTRKDAEQTLVNHPGFRNGACGAALMYRLLERESGLANYQKGYEFWLNRSVQLFNQQINENAFLNREHDFVTGLPGMALTWLGYLHGRETGWAELFLP